MIDVLVTGGTGALGSELVPRLITKGYDVRVLSRRENPPVPVGARAVRGDLTTGEGVAEATSGADVIVHCATGAADGGMRAVISARATERTDVEPTRVLLDIAKRNGSVRFVYPSIVGVDRIPLGYYRTKLACERVIEESGVPYTIFRSTQWHTFAAEVCRRLTAAPVVMAPKGFRSQLLDPGEVAERVVALIEQDVEGHAPDMGGPVALSLREIVRAYLSAVGKRRAVLQVPIPGKTMRGLREGLNLAPEHADGRITWEAWLEKNTA
jgi:uncharacterized protein YbjT (DUF2867 family)